MTNPIHLHRACAAACDVSPPDEERQAATLRGRHVMPTDWTADTPGTRWCVRGGCLWFLSCCLLWMLAVESCSLLVDMSVTAAPKVHELACTLQRIYPHLLIWTYRSPSCRDGARAKGKFLSLHSCLSRRTSAACYSQGWSTTTRSFIETPRSDSSPDPHPEPSNFATSPCP